MVGGILIAIVVLLIAGLVIYTGFIRIPPVYRGLVTLFGGRTDREVGEGLAWLFLRGLVRNVILVYMGRQTLKIIIDRAWPKDRVRLEFTVLVSFQVLPGQLRAFVDVIQEGGIERILEILTQAVKEASWIVLSGFTHEEVIGFARMTERTRRRTPATIARAKVRLHDEILTAVQNEVNLQRLGIEVVSIRIGDLDAADQESKDALQAEEQTTFRRREAIIRTGQYAEQTGIVYEAAKATGQRPKFTDVYSGVVDDEIDLAAADKGRQVELTLTREIRSERPKRRRR